MDLENSGVSAYPVNIAAVIASQRSFSHHKKRPRSRLKGRWRALYHLGDAGGGRGTGAGEHIGRGSGWLSAGPGDEQAGRPNSSLKRTGGTPLACDSGARVEGCGGSAPAA
jgi:hypothetical protein